MVRRRAATNFLTAVRRHSGGLQGELNPRVFSYAFYALADGPSLPTWDSSSAQVLEPMVPFQRA
jgi:hypothetical protein